MLGETDMRGPRWIASHCRFYTIDKSSAKRHRDARFRSTPPMPALKHRTLSAAILDQIRQTILDGSTPAGTQLRQDALAELYGVSRIPVREALFQLEAEGLVRMVPHKGAVVSDLSLGEVDDVFDLRALLEPRLLAAALPHYDAALFESLEAIQGRFVAAIAAGDVARWGVLNAEFHMALYGPAPQPRTRQVVAGLLQTSDRYTRMQLSTPAAMRVAEREHRGLIDLCRAGDPAPACALLVRHIETVRAGLRRVLGQA
jgi:DNA-binding GntR family transcriptional regulator